MSAELPPMALEEVVNRVTGEITWRPVEAPPCGARLDMPEHGVRLVCDLPRDHHGKHAMVLGGNYPLHWCDDNCAHRCDVPLSALYKIRTAGGTP